tara:strand:- start:353 stop:1033 length:681 start_codon:yes stop_codon:yes gene_type:complete
VRKFKPKQKKDFVCNLSDFQIGELIGSFAGDGNFYYSSHGRSGHYRIRYYLSYKDDMDYSKYLSHLLEMMNLRTNTFFKKYKGKLSVIELVVRSKDFYKFIRKYLIWEGKKTYSVRLKSYINGYSDDFLRGFVRGLMDTDGFVEISGVAFGVVSRDLVLNFEAILSKFNIGSKLSIKPGKGNCKDCYLCRIPRRYLELYNEIFGFSNLRKINSLMKILSKTGTARI